MRWRRPKLKLTHGDLEEMWLLNLSVGPSVVDGLLEVRHILLPADHRDCLDVDVVHAGHTAVPGHRPLCNEYYSRRVITTLD